mmetsp:Transcript_756/g.963  ORF Transcript_756/g.963 Transcript_756/m.963 type:complete len:390 (-) Transcript_756:41-1210(-)
MRFRCEMSVEGIKTLMSVVRSLERAEIGRASRQQLRCVLWLSVEEVNLGLVVGQVQESMLAFATLKSRGGIFTNYLVESAAGNNVFLSLILSQFSRALASAGAPKNAGLSSTIKLAKRSGTAQLLVQFEAMQGSKVEHAIPVKLLRRHEIEPYSAPNLPPPKIALELPAAHTIRTLVERLKAVGDRDPGRGKRVDLKLEANGTLALRLVADSAVIKAFFSHLKRVSTCNHSSQQPDDNVLISVDSRNLAHALHAYTLDFDLIECCPIEDRVLLLNVKLAGNVGDLLYYVPLLDIDEEDAYYYPEDDAQLAHKADEEQDYDEMNHYRSTLHPTTSADDDDDDLSMRGLDTVCHHRENNKKRSRDDDDGSHDQASSSYLLPNSKNPLSASY